MRSSSRRRDVFLFLFLDDAGDCCTPFTRVKTRGKCGRWYHVACVSQTTTPTGAGGRRRLDYCDLNSEGNGDFYRQDGKRTDEMVGVDTRQDFRHNKVVSKYTSASFQDYTKRLWVRFQTEVPVDVFCFPVGPRLDFTKS